MWHCILCMVLLCTQNMRRDGSSYRWLQPCNNQTEALSTEFRWIFQNALCKLRSLKQTGMQLDGTGSARKQIIKPCSCHSETLKPVLNWANVCSPNILQTVRRTMIRFLIELLVRRTWFGQFEEFICSQLACNEMQASARTCGRRAADSMIENVG